MKGVLIQIPRAGTKSHSSEEGEKWQCTWPRKHVKYHGEHPLQGGGPVSAPGEHDLNENGASMQQTLTAVSADTKERDWVTELREHGEHGGNAASFFS
jgi:hypothetical protein